MLLMAPPSDTLLRMADVLILRVYFLVDGSLNRRGNWFCQQIPLMISVLRMRTFGPFDILLLSSMRGVAVDRDNHICGCAHVEGFWTGPRYVFALGLWSPMGNSPSCSSHSSY